MVVCRFEIFLPDVDPLNLDILYPIQTLKPIASKLRSQVQTDVGESDMSWTEKLHAVVSEVPIVVAASLLEKKIPIAKLTELMEGESMVVSLPEDVKLKVSDRAYFVGDIGEVDGNRAVNITKKLIVPSEVSEV